MSTVATIVAVLAVAGAVASWIAGVVFYIRTLRAASDQGPRAQTWKAVVAWPFFSRQATGAAAEHAAKVNKALVAFFTCLMIAVAATSLATNLSRLSR
jgi:hypothetical protein